MKSRSHYEKHRYDQLKNIPGILAVIDKLKDLGFGISEMDIRNGIDHYQKTTGLKGRWQILQTRPQVIADIAHNQAGLENITQQLLKLQYSKLYIILGFMKEKDIGKILPLFPQDAEYVFVSLRFHGPWMPGGWRFRQHYIILMAV